MFAVYDNEALGTGAEPRLLEEHQGTFHVAHVESAPMAQTNSPVQRQPPSIPQPKRSSLPSPLLPHRPLPPIPLDTDSRHLQDAIPTQTTHLRAQPATNTSIQDITPTAPPHEAEALNFFFNQQTLPHSAATASTTIKQQIDLHQYAWYFGTMSREISESQLHGMRQNGAFLVRQSQRGGANYPYAISVYFNGTVYHLLVRLKTNCKFALGAEKVSEPEFETMAALVAFHRRHAVYVGVSNDTVLLTTWPAKLT